MQSAHSTNKQPPPPSLARIPPLGFPIKNPAIHGVGSLSQPFPRSSGSPYTFKTIVPFVVFFFVLGFWTWELLAENPVPESISKAIPGEWKFYLAKGLHVSVYALLTLLAAWLPIPRVTFGLIVVGLLAHGIATEVGQSYTAKRTGKVEDVVLDWVGILAGLIVVEGWNYLKPRRYMH